MKNIREEISRFVQFGVFVALWLAIIAITHSRLTIDWEAVKAIPDAITIYVILHLLFVKWGWRLKFLHPWLVPYPDLQGTWEGEVRSTWINPTTGAGVSPIPSKLVIRQTFSSISCVLLTGESQSYSVAAQINEDDDSGVLRLSYAYTNRPRARVRFRSEIHDGAAILTVKEEKEFVLDGEYWTSRKTTGEMTFTRVSRKTALPVMRDDGTHPVTEKVLAPK
jgi:hypothetical protein